jgi:integrase
MTFAKPIPPRQLSRERRYPDRNRVILLLSVKAGLRTKEIAALTWDMLTDAEGNLGSAIHLRNEASKGRSGRVIPLNRDLRKALRDLFQVRGTSPYVITSERGQRTSAAVIVNLFAGWYRTLQSLWPAELHHRRRQKNLNRRRLSQRRADVGGACGSEHDPALHRGGRRGAEKGGGPSLRP